MCRVEGTSSETRDEGYGSRGPEATVDRVRGEREKMNVLVNVIPDRLGGDFVVEFPIVDPLGTVTHWAGTEGVGFFYSTPATVSTVSIPRSVVNS